MNEAKLTIAAVEREVGLSKDVLRVWERRYGFPSPERDANGERLYPASQVDRLRHIKRLMDQGHRPGRLLSLGPDELPTLTRPAGDAPPSTSIEPDAELSAAIALLRGHRATDLLERLHHRLARQGLMGFVQDTAVPLTAAVGDAWERGELQVHEEHLFTELLQRVLRQAISSVPPGRAPRVLLTTAPGEPHELGLLMAEAALALEGAHCISLGTQTPILEIVRAAAAHRADVIALSFSAAFPRRQVPALLQQLRAGLPAALDLWSGGSGMSGIAPQHGVLTIAGLQDAVQAVAGWREAHGDGSEA